MFRLISICALGNERTWLLNLDEIDQCRIDPVVPDVYLDPLDVEIPTFQMYLGSYIEVMNV